MSAFYEEMAVTALELIAEYGMVVPLFRTASDGSVTEHAITGVFTAPITNYIHPAQLEPVEKRGVFDATFELKVNDKVVHDGDWYVMRVETVKPSSVVLVYRIEFRRG
jgi:hypothetical protein